MTFGGALDSMLRRAGYSIVSEFVTPDRRSAVRLRALTSPAVIVMFHSDAVELARGAVTVSAIARRNRSVFGADALARIDDSTSWRQ
jgi:hypothetical protein